MGASHHQGFAESPDATDEKRHRDWTGFDSRDIVEVVVMS
jgi:hypothetical protein